MSPVCCFYACSFRLHLYAASSFTYASRSVLPDGHGFVAAIRCAAVCLFAYQVTALQAGLCRRVTDLA